MSAPEQEGREAELARWHDEMRIGGTLATEAMQQLWDHEPVTVDGEVYGFEETDDWPEDAEMPMIMVRRSDGARFHVIWDVSAHRLAETEMRPPEVVRVLRFLTPGQAVEVTQISAIGSESAHRSQIYAQGSCRRCATLVGLARFAGKDYGVPLPDGSRPSFPEGGRWESPRVARTADEVEHPETLAVEGKAVPDTAVVIEWHSAARCAAAHAARQEAGS